jgi:hypothetical protein
MKSLIACAIAYAIALCAWSWSIRAPEPRPVFQIIDIRFCPDWRDRQLSRCDTIPFRKEVEI